MKTISLAIPFYNTISKYFLDCIKYALDNDFVSEIVVNDDCSSQTRNMNNLTYFS
jgi:glycosyltransferase involved in cell wall biosynthesis